MAHSLQSGKPNQANRLELPGEISRKSVHVLTIALPISMLWLGKWYALVLLIPLSVVALSCDVLRVRAPKFNNWIDKYFGFMMRDNERPSPGMPVVINGATWILIGMTVLTLLFSVEIAVPILLLFILGDAAAALIGRKFGRIHWGSSPRTVEGSLAFCFVGLAVISVFPIASLWSGVICVIVAALAEALPKPINDNLWVPLVTATIALILNGI